MPMLLERPCLYHSSGYNMRCSYSKMSLCLSAGSLRTRITPCCPPPAPSHRTWHSVVRKRHSFIYTWQARNSWAGSWVCAHICVCVCVYVRVHLCMCQHAFSPFADQKSQSRREQRVEGVLSVSSNSSLLPHSLMQPS